MRRADNESKHWGTRMTDRDSEGMDRSGDAIREGFCFRVNFIFTRAR